jgi:hypothetical protein
VMSRSLRLTTISRVSTRSDPALAAGGPRGRLRGTPSGRAHHRALRIRRRPDVADVPFQHVRVPQDPGWTRRNMLFADSARQRGLRHYEYLAGDHCYKTELSARERVLKAYSQAAKK